MFFGQSSLRLQNIIDKKDYYTFNFIHFSLSLHVVSFIYIATSQWQPSRHKRQCNPPQINKPKPSLLKSQANPKGNMLGGIAPN
jgi:hypothetical protein